MIRTWPKTNPSLVEILSSQPTPKFEGYNHSDHCAPRPVTEWETLLRSVGVTELDMELMERAQSKRERKNAKRLSAGGKCAH